MKDDIFVLFLFGVIAISIFSISRCALEEKKIDACIRQPELVFCEKIK